MKIDTQEEYERSEDAFYNQEQDKHINKLLSEPWWYGVIKFIGIIFIVGFILFILKV